MLAHDHPRRGLCLRSPVADAKKLRALELKAGKPSRRGRKGTAAGYSLKEVRRRERELAEQAERGYRQPGRRRSDSRSPRVEAAARVLRRREIQAGGLLWANSAAVNDPGDRVSAVDPATGHVVASTLLSAFGTTGLIAANRMLWIPAADGHVLVGRPSRAP